MPRRPSRRFQLGRVQLVIAPGRMTFRRRLGNFTRVHRHALGVLVVLVVAVVLVIVHERQLAAVTVGSVFYEACKMFGDVVADRFFEG